MEQNRIIVIDDCRLTLQMTRDILEKEGYAVCTVDSGFDLCKSITAGKKPALMLIDVTMPLVAGDTLVKVLKENAETKGIPLFFYSSRPEPELQSLVAATGADGYLTKASSPEELVNAVRQIVL
jgi:DNA-binding response OmpR family regulator